MLVASPITPPEDMTLNPAGRGRNPGAGGKGELESEGGGREKNGKIQQSPFSCTCLTFFLFGWSHRRYQRKGTKGMRGRVISDGVSLVFGG